MPARVPSPTCPHSSYDGFIEDALPGDLLVGFCSSPSLNSVTIHCSLPHCHADACSPLPRLRMTPAWPATVASHPPAWLICAFVQVVDGGMVSLEVLSKAGPDITARVVDPGPCLRLWVACGPGPVGSPHAALGVVCLCIASPQSTPTPLLALSLAPCRPDPEPGQPGAAAGGAHGSLQERAPASHFCQGAAPPAALMPFGCNLAGLQGVPLQQQLVSACPPWRAAARRRMRGLPLGPPPPVASGQRAAPPVGSSRHLLPAAPAPPVGPPCRTGETSTWRLPRAWTSFASAL